MTSELPAADPSFPLAEHPLRRRLADEVHARPYQPLRAPVRVSHLAVSSGEQAEGGELAHLEALCGQAGIAPPPAGAIHFTGDFAGFRLRWERHTEFSSYSFHRPEGFADAFAATALGAVPASWLAGIPGQVLAAVHLAVDGTRRDADDLAGIFAGHPVIGSKVVGGAAEVFTDFHLHGDGFGRILVYDQGLTPGQTGRLVQRLLEIETYRAMALLAFPAARRLGPQLTVLDRALTDIVAAMAGPVGETADRQLLARLIDLAAEAEHRGAEHSYRFSAAKAYYGLVCKRISDLREERLTGMQTINEFMDRRLGPAMSTVESTTARHAGLSRRIARAADLLRTRVDIALDENNRELLRSMNRRAALQLRMQETVEGLSVVAISYYLLGLLSYAAKGAKAAGLHIDSDLVVLAGLPVVAGLVALGVRRLRRAIVKKE
ncbi:MAG TPA: DUF3422 domain-containing protein [Rhodospirillaceae bacterium]|nr:DUF3422 domain-containing protein [Rhodospirillaceae bacterium]